MDIRVDLENHESFGVELDFTPTPINIIESSFNSITEGNEMFPPTCGQPRPIFISISYLIKSWRSVPLDILYDSIFFFGSVKKSWLFPAQMSDWLDYQHSFLPRLDITPLFLQLLQEKEKQGLIIYMPENMDTNVKSRTSFDLYSTAVIGNNGRLPLPMLRDDSNSGGMVSTLPLPPPMKSRTPNLAHDSDTGSGRQRRRHSRQESSPNVGTRVNSVSDKAHSSFAQFSDQLSAIIDPITRHTYAPLNLEIQSWSQMDTKQLQYIESINPIINELRCADFKFRPILEIIAQSNPNLLPMIDWIGSEEYDSKSVRIHECYLRSLPQLQSHNQSLKSEGSTIQMCNQSSSRLSQIPDDTSFATDHSLPTDNSLHITLDCVIDDISVDENKLTPKPPLSHMVDYSSDSGMTYVMYNPDTSSVCATPV